MLLKTKCPKCEKTLRCPEERINSVVRCSACQHKFRVTTVSSGSASMAGQPSMEAQYTLDSSGTKSPAAEAISTVQGSASSDRSTERLNRSRDSTSSRGSALQREAFAAQPSLGRFGQYDLKAILGSGGFGVVYHAWDTQLGRQVAVKVPRFDMTEERKARRFRQEARAAAKLQHPNIVVVFDEGTQDGKPYIVSEFVDGEPLSVRIERGRPNSRLAVQWVRDLAVALDYAHDQGVVHRDIKPENIMLGKHGRPQIMDFGLAKQLDEDSSLSIDGSVMGTPNYMAPEQARGEISAVEGRSDQYSLGVILYELLTGTKPFSGPVHAVLAKVADRNHHPAPPRNIDPKISRDLEAICLMAISKESADRYPRLSEMASDLDRWLTGKATKVRPLSRPDQLIRWCRNNRALAIASSATAVAVAVVNAGKTAMQSKGMIGCTIAVAVAVAGLFLVILGYALAVLTS
jgi:serine/threonine protein kinase